VAVQVEYVSAELDSEDPSMDEFKAIFDKFATPEELTKVKDEPVKVKEVNMDDAMAAALGVVGDGDEDEDGEEGAKISRKARKKLDRLSVAELKQLVERPDVVEAHDITAGDPRLLVWLKSYRNSVPVPRHWCHKRKYLQGKRGLDKTPFELPEFIAQTGIEKIRTAIIEQEEQMKAKQKARARVKPKSGRIDIDYQVLHDAFFKYQKKPQLSGHGDIYYEGKEFEVKLREKKPGQLTAELKTALGMPDNAPPPWLINMQRYGPPPSYPSLKIAGLNAPLPEGASFGYHPGGWGKPPVDEYGRPIYGDVFGQAEASAATAAPEVDHTLWGELGSESEEEEESDEEEEDEEGEGEDEDVSGMDTPSTTLASGMTSVTDAIDDDSQIDLRKRAGTETPDTSGIASAPKELYQVVQQQATDVGSGLFGTDKKYVVPAGGDVAVSINPDQLESQVGNEDFLAKQFEEGTPTGGTDSVLADEQRKRKRKAEKDKAGKKSKYDDFKF